MEPEKVKIVCPHCDAINAVPTDRSARQANCGKCHKPLFTGSPVDLEGGRFDRHVRRSDIPVVVDFWAPWCGPCRAMAPAFEQAARELEPKLRFAKVDIDKAPDLAARYGVQGVPTLVVFRNGEEADRQVGALPGSQLRAWIERHSG